MSIDPNIDLGFGGGGYTLPNATAPVAPAAPALNPNDIVDIEILLKQAQLANMTRRPAAPGIPSAAIPDPDLFSKQNFAREQDANRAALERELQRTAAENASRSQQKQQEFSGAENEKAREIERQRLQLDGLQQQQRAANDAAMRALEQGQLNESRRQFDVSQQLADQRHQLEKQVAQQEFEQGQQQFAFGALKFLTELAQNPRTALASFFLNRGQTPPDAVGQTSPVPAGLNVTNVAETLPGFLQGIMGAARQGQGAAATAGVPSSAPAAAPLGGATAIPGSQFGGGNIASALGQAGVIPPFLQRVLAQQQGDVTQGTNTPQAGGPPPGVPLVSSLALIQMSPSERLGFQGLVESSGMRWEDYLDLVKRSSPQGQAAPVGTGVPQFAFTPQ